MSEKRGYQKNKTFIKKKLRGEAKCANCKWGVFAYPTLTKRPQEFGHCTRLDGTTKFVLDDNTCKYWGDLEIDEGTKKEYYKMKEELRRNKY